MMGDIVNDYFKTFYPSAELLESAKREYSMVGWTVRTEPYTNNLFRPMLCADGFTMSVQGHYGAYSCPRDDFADRYSTVEIGFPSEHEPLLDGHQDGDGDPTDTVYGYVPISLVIEVIEKHGGLTGPAPDEAE